MMARLDNLAAVGHLPRSSALRPVWGSPDTADFPPWLVYDANDPFETCAAQGFRSAKALFAPSLKRDIVPSIACTQPPAGGVAWQSTSDGETSYSHWAAHLLRGRLLRVRSKSSGCG